MFKRNYYHFKDTYMYCMDIQNLLIRSYIHISSRGSSSLDGYFATVYLLTNFPCGTDFLVMPSLIYMCTFTFFLECDFYNKI